LIFRNNEKKDAKKFKDPAKGFFSYYLCSEFLMSLNKNLEKKRIQGIRGADD